MSDIDATKAPSPTMKRACLDLFNHGGSGAILKNRTVLAQGEVLGLREDDEVIEAFAWVTWARLRNAGYITVENRHVILTSAGQALAKAGKGKYCNG